MSENSKLGTVARLTAIATLVSVMIGVAISVYQLYDTLTAAKGTLSALKLQALQQVTGFLDNNSAVRQELAGYLSDRLSQDEALVKKLINAGGVGEDVYFSKPLEAYRRITAHYERLGAVVELGYLDFDIVFEVIAFPDRFWEKTQPMRGLLGKNWHGTALPLGDFESGFRKLCLRYQSERRLHHLPGASNMRCNE